MQKPCHSSPTPLKNMQVATHDFSSEECNIAPFCPFVLIRIKALGAPPPVSGTPSKPQGMKISIITTTFNSAKTLPHTIQSVLAQTYHDIEYIIVDGASTDGTVDIIQAYEPQFHGRLKYISERDKGIYDAMNKGLRMATGDVAGFLNSDDFLSGANAVERLMNALQNAPEKPDAVYADVHYVDDNDLSRSVRYYSSAVFRPWLMRLGFMPAHPTFYCRMEVYRKYGFFDTQYKIAADFELLLRLLYVHRIRTRYVHTDCVTMRTGGASNASFHSRMAIMRDHLHALRRHGVRSCYALLVLRYFYKAWELATSRFHRATPRPDYIA